MNFAGMRTVVAMTTSRCAGVTSIGEETLEYKQLSETSGHDDQCLNSGPPGHAPVECLSDVATLRLVEAIHRLVLHYLITNTPHRLATAYSNYVRSLSKYRTATMTSHNFTNSQRSLIILDNATYVVRSRPRNPLFMFVKSLLLLRKPHSWF